MASLVISVQAAGFGFTQLGGSPGVAALGIAAMAKPLVGAAFGYFVANTLLVATAIVVDGAGCVWVTGFSEGIGSFYDIATVAYSNGGAPLATNRFDGLGNNSDQANAITLGSGGAVYVAGFSTTAAGDNDFTTIKYSRAVGPLLSMQKAGGTLVLSWPNPAFSLQSAGSINGAYSNILAATSPYTNPVLPTQKFFRLISN
jgi:hypothetical protein